jgi:uncharacterized membrane protein YbaN (DUF454 family)
MMEMSETRRGRIVRAACVIGGGLCVGLAVLGVILPLLPTTPFLLLAAALYFRGSKRMYHWLLNNRHFGHIVRDYRSGQGIPRRAKVYAIALVWLTIGATATFAISAPWARLMLVAVALGVTLYLVRLPARSQLPG